VTNPVVLTSPVALAAAGQARLYELLYRALGVPFGLADGLWFAGAVGPVVFPVAGTLRPDVDARAVRSRLPAAAGRVTVSDAWGRLDLASLGMSSTSGDPWMMRVSRLVEVPPVRDLAVVRARTADQVSLVEATVVEAAGGLPSGYVPGSVHPAQASLRLADLHLFLGLLDGEPVGTAMAAVGERTVFVSGVSVIPVVRERGIGSALTAAALRVAPHLPATLRSTAAGRGIYRRLGFAVVGHPVDWIRVA